MICHACDGGRTDERTDGKWKIEQCSVGPETAISELNISDVAGAFMSTDTFSSTEPDKKNTKEENYKIKIRQTRLSLSKTLQHPDVPLLRRP